MPTPSTAQAANSATGPFAAASATSPIARTTFESTRTPRPPWRSISRPTAGPANAAINNAPEKAPNTHSRDTPVAAPIGPARIAGR
jgi:hypothetical protein